VSERGQGAFSTWFWNLIIWYVFLLVSELDKWNFTTSSPHGKNFRCPCPLRCEDCSWWCHKNCEFHPLTSKKHLMFSKLCRDMQAFAMRFLYNVEARLLSRGIVLKRCFISTAPRVAVFLTQQGHLMSTNFQYNFWLAKLSLLAHKSFEFAVARDMMYLKLPVRLSVVKLWQKKVSEGDFSDFKCLQKVFRSTN